MNKFMVLAGFLFASSISQASKITIVSEELTTNGNVVAGQVAVTTIDEATKTVKMEIFDDPCGSLNPKGGLNCLAVASKATELNGTYSQKKTSSCGDTYDTGDSLNGLQESRILVTDYSNAICEIALRYTYVMEAFNGATQYQASSNLASSENKQNSLSTFVDVQIFSKLNLKPRLLNTAQGEKIEIKSVGNFSCMKVSTVYPGLPTQGECKYKDHLISPINDSLQAQRIYEALNVPEDLELVPGMNRASKRVGRLVCERNQVLVPNVNSKAVYSCDLGSH